MCSVTDVHAVCSVTYVHAGCSVTDTHAGCSATDIHVGCSVIDLHSGCVLLQTYTLSVLLQMYMLPVFCYRRTCWVCFASDEDDREAEWVRPCCCRGTTKWVHQLCLQRWIDEKQKGNSTAKVHCPQCGKEYLIIFPKVGKYPGMTALPCQQCPNIPPDFMASEM